MTRTTATTGPAAAAFRLLPAIALATLAAAPAEAKTLALGVAIYSYDNSGTLYGPHASDNGDVALSGSSYDGFDSASATTANGGTTISTSAGNGGAFHAAASEATAAGVFDLPSNIHGTAVVKLSGWASVVGTAQSFLNFAFEINGKPIDADALTFTSGYHHVAKTFRINWQGGDSFFSDIYAGTVVRQGDTGFASAYLDPVMTTTVGGVPEPAAWSLLVAGFGLVGVAARRRAAPIAHVAA